MKKKSKDPSNMSPRELARYTVIHAIDDLEEYYKDRSKSNGSKHIQTKRSIYEARIQGLSKDEYIEYLEQLLRENEYQRHKTAIEYILFLSKIYLLCCEIRHDLWGDCVESEKNDQIKYIEESEKEIVDMKKELDNIDKELASNGYLTDITISDTWIKSTWAKMQ